MRVALFIPCYIDQLYPDVGLATLEVLERFGCEVVYPDQQTCCGQPMANTGCADAARPVAQHFERTFRPYEYVVGPSGSCVAMVRRHYEGLITDRAAHDALAAKTFELCEFLTDVLGVDRVEGAFPHRVGLHQSCHGLRELSLGSGSELHVPPFNKTRRLLGSLEGIELVELERQDECCGFGGTFAVSEEAVSTLMGDDRLDDHQRAGAQVITAGDMSCLMHLDGLIQRQGRPLRVMHVAQVLAGRKP